ncbi:MAG: pantetheine-phosphate adenylyltransferase [Spirochaetaceae bacterium]|jgi:pantetheine-phosphate adenylyltransferase|nr:pantetheine-phosphate adenylyltransferase [Spirochaetaceae bacterium]
MGARKKIAVYAGSFDPPTFGHLDIIKRASAMFAGLHVVVAQNNRKKYLFPVEERISLMEALCRKMRNVKVAATSALVIDYMRESDIKILVRGVRNADDFSAEASMALWNKALYAKAETVFLPSSPELAYLNSSGVKEVIAFGGDFSSFVPLVVREALTKKLKAGIIGVDSLVSGTNADGVEIARSLYRRASDLRAVREEADRADVQSDGPAEDPQKAE